MVNDAPCAHASNFTNSHPGASTQYGVLMGTGCGAWHTVHSARRMPAVHGTWHTAPNARCISQCYGASCVVQGVWCMVHGERCVVRGAWCVVKGAVASSTVHDVHPTSQNLATCELHCAPKNSSGAIRELNRGTLCLVSYLLST